MYDTYDQDVDCMADCSISWHWRLGLVEYLVGSLRLRGGNGNGMLFLAVRGEICMHSSRQHAASIGRFWFYDALQVRDFITLPSVYTQETDSVLSLSCRDENQAQQSILL